MPLTSRISPRIPNNTTNEVAADAIATSIQHRPQQTLKKRVRQPFLYQISFYHLLIHFNVFLTNTDYVGFNMYFASICMRYYFPALDLVKLIAYKHIRLTKEWPCAVIFR